MNAGKSGAALGRDQNGPVLNGDNQSITESAAEQKKH
jgi:hypothetical protein